ncbi:hypothetical protein TELCIR_19540 [Teladorsagia circumcincta]|uniref:Uncharacterized protein n=1 Tax=Teladorsagia circumcincta TaxID=45464 RepID=A0A2G9TLX7_TELCI|nr:hypothetical protein TELCIR_19540 [Teladorsagia circumcincta]
MRVVEKCVLYKVAVKSDEKRKRSNSNNILFSPSEQQQYSFDNIVTTNEEINANNFNPIGWGEGGRAVRLSKEDERLSDETFGINQFSLFVSDRIALNRSLDDYRKPSCRAKKYRAFLKYPTLDEAVKNYPVPVKILRTKQRVGLIRARLMGAQYSDKMETLLGHT